MEIHLKIPIIILFAGALSACQTSNQNQNTIAAQDDPRITSLNNMASEFYMNTAMANVIANKCPSIGFDRNLFSRLNKIHTKKYGAAGVLLQKRLISKSLAGFKSKFERKHGVVVEKSDLCNAGKREISEKTPLSVLLKI